MPMHSVDVVFFLSVTAATRASLLMHPQGGKFAVCILHKLLHHLLEVRTPGRSCFGSGGRSWGGMRRTRFVIRPSVVGRKAGGILVAKGLLRRRSRCLFYGKVNATGIVNTDDLDANLLTFLQMILYFADVGVGDLRDMYQTRTSTG